MALINIKGKGNNKNIILDKLDNKSFLVKIPSIALMTTDDLKIKGVPVDNTLNIINKLDVIDPIHKYKTKKRKVKRDTFGDDIICDQNGNVIGSVSDTEFKYLLKDKRRKKVNKKDKILQTKTETYLPISKMLDIYKEGYTIYVSNSDDVTVINDIINDVLDMIENNINVNNKQLEHDLKDFLKVMVNLNTVKITSDKEVKDESVMDDMFGTDIFDTSPVPKRYDLNKMRIN